MLQETRPVFESGRQNIPALSSKILPLSFTQVDEVRNGYTNVTFKGRAHFVDLSATAQFTIRALPRLLALDTSVLLPLSAEYVTRSQHQ